MPGHSVAIHATTSNATHAIYASYATTNATVRKFDEEVKFLQHHKEAQG